MTTSASAWLALAAFDGLLAVAAGAFGAHGVSDPAQKELLRTGAQYQLAHAAAALALRALPLTSGALALSGWLMSVGALLFAGSLYALAFSGVRVLGVITPLGGVLMILGWAVVLGSFATGRA